MNKLETAELLKIIISIYPKANYPDLQSTAHAWALIMPDVSYKMAEIALMKLLREKTFDPTTGPMPAEIVKACESLTIDPNAAPPFNEFWRLIQKAISTHGYDRWPEEWGHPTMNAIARQYKYEVCLADNSQQTNIQAQVRNAYEAECKRFKEAKRNLAVAKITGNEQKINEIAEAVAGKIGNNKSPFKLIEKKEPEPDTRPELTEEQIREIRKKLDEPDEFEKRRA